MPDRLRKRLRDATLYVLIHGGDSEDGFATRVATLIESGVHVLQLRDKTLDDRHLIQRARVLRRLTKNSGTLFVMNDRPDLALLASADGVHVGQEELTVNDVRRIVGVRMLVGVSTHSIEQARQAVQDGADYIGVGPVFPSGTKQFSQFPGLDLVRVVSREVDLPAFAIGGISHENINEVLAAGFRRVAVSGVISSAKEPGEAVRQLLDALATQRD